MNSEALLAYVLFVVLLAVFSREVWTDPEGFLRKRRGARQKAYRASLGFLARHPYIRTLDKNPRWEIALTRMGFVLIYLLVIGIGAVLLRSGMVR